MTLTKKLICMITVFAAFMSLTACEMPMTVIGSIPEPRDTVESFFDSVCAGDFAESDKYLSGVSISMKKQAEGEFAQKLYDYLIKSYRYKINGQVTSELLDADCKVDFTYLDFNALAGDLKTASTTLGKRYMSSELKEDYVEKKNGSYSLTDEGAEKVASEALDILMENQEKYLSTRSFDIKLKYSQGKWLIDLPDELFYAICGGFELSE